MAEPWEKYRAWSSPEEMASDSGSEIGNEAKSMEHKKKRKKDNVSGDSSCSWTRSDRSFLVGMVAVTREDGIFNNPHEVGRFITDKVGAIKSIRITRSGLVVIECSSKQQRDKVLKIDVYLRHLCVKCFSLDTKEGKKGVVSGVPLKVKPERFMDVPSVCGVRRLTRIYDGKRQPSTSLCLTFSGDLPEKVFVDYVCYRVRPFEKTPLRCYACQEYGHVAAVCRGFKKCGSCGNRECENEECKDKGEEPKCLHCSGNHRAGLSECPRKDLEKRVIGIRNEQKMSYAEAVSKAKAEKEQKEVCSRNGKYITLELKCFLAFIAMVINCASGLHGKSDRIHMILDAAKRFLNVENITGEDLDLMLREGFVQGDK